MTRVLVVEDDRDINGLLARGLEAEGFLVSVAERVDDALRVARHESPAAVVLDVTLQDGTGHDLCRSLREGGYSGAILFLSARDEISDRAEGLALGADDYIVKPFAFDELVARLQTHLLRRSQAPRTTFTLGRLVLDLATLEVRLGEASLRLTARESDVLALFMAKPNRPIARRDIFDQVWTAQGGLSLNVVDVYVGYLRTKLADLVRFGGPIITTVRGRGFMLEPQERDFRR